MQLAGYWAAHEAGPGVGFGLLPSIGMGLVIRLSLLWGRFYKRVGASAWCFIFLIFINRTPKYFAEIPKRPRYFIIEDTLKWGPKQN